MATAAARDWSVEQSVEEQTECGAFGPGARFVSFALDGRHTEHEHASTMLYGTVTVREQEGGVARSCRLAIKMKHRDPGLRRMFKNDLQFSNEILFYERILPFFTAAAPEHGCPPPFCRYFFGRNDCGDLECRDMVVLENVATRGYRSARTDHHLFLDFDHAAVALRTLAKFHALSYRAKRTNRSKFAEIVDGIEETQWNATGEWIVPGDGLEKLLAAALDRLAERASSARGDGETLRRFRTELLTDAKRNLKRTMEPVEPLAVLCHGDFNRNNLMFRYDDRGQPVDALPFDMATVRYGSPALDLSFFLYMNTDRRLRDARWDAMLDEYCAALSASVTGLAGRESAPDRARIDAEMRDRAFCGVVYASFFLRVMMEKHVVPDMLQYARMDNDERVRYVLPLGGEEAADAVADIVQHFVDIARRHCENGLSRGGSKI